MIYFLMFFGLSTSASTMKLEKLVRHDLPAVLSYDFTRPSRSIRFEAHGWYTSDEKGLKERAFFIKGRSIAEKKKHKTRVLFETRNQIAVTLMNEQKFCEMKNSYEIHQTSAHLSFAGPSRSSFHCALASVLDKQIHQISFLPVKWPWDIESANGPTHISPRVVVPVAEKIDHLLLAPQIIQITTYELEGDLLQIHLRGVVEVPDDKEIKIHGRLSWDTKKKMAVSQIWNYQYPSENNKTGQLRALRLEMSQE